MAVVANNVQNYEEQKEDVGFLQFRSSDTGCGELKLGPLEGAAVCWC